MENSININDGTKRIMINGQEYAVIERILNKDLGYILKCCSLYLKHYHELYFLEGLGNNYSLIIDPQTIMKVMEDNAIPKDYADVMLFVDETIKSAQESIIPEREYDKAKLIKEYMERLLVNETLGRDPKFTKNIQHKLEANIKKVEYKDIEYNRSL